MEILVMAQAFKGFAFKRLQSVTLCPPFHRKGRGSSVKLENLVFLARPYNAM
jgi:hypothetical protein